MGETVTSAGGKAILEAIADGGWYTSRDVSGELGCSKYQVSKNFKEFSESGVVDRRENEGKHGAHLHKLSDGVGIGDVLTHREKQLRSPCSFETLPAGYERARSQLDGEYETVLIHRLVAVAEHGFEAVAGRGVHHETGIPWDNRPTNLKVKIPSDHTREHWHGKPLVDRVGEASDRELAGALEQSGYGDLAETLRGRVRGDDG